MTQFAWWREFRFYTKKSALCKRSLLQKTLRRSKRTGIAKACCTFLRRIWRMRHCHYPIYANIPLSLPVHTFVPTAGDDKPGGGLPTPECPRLCIAKTQISARMMNSRGCPINFIRTFNYADAFSSFCCHIAAVSRREAIRNRADIPCQTSAVAKV